MPKIARPDMRAVIETLASGEADLGPPYERQKALFDLVAFMNFPFSPATAANYVSLLTGMYYTQKLGAESHKSLREGELKFILDSNLVSQTTTALCSVLHKFHEATVAAEPHKDNTHPRNIANIVRFLLSFDNRELTDEELGGEALRAASVRNAYYFFKKTRAFGRKYPSSEKYFRKSWIEYKSAAAFIYVDEFSFRRRFWLNPAKPTFSRTVDEIVADLPTLRSFLGQCKFAQRRILEITTGKTYHRVYLPKFPTKLAEVPIAKSPIDGDTLEQMTRYRPRL